LCDKGGRFRSGGGTAALERRRTRDLLAYSGRLTGPPKPQAALAADLPAA